MSVNFSWVGVADSVEKDNFGLTFSWYAGYQYPYNYNDLITWQGESVYTRPSYNNDLITWQEQVLTQADFDACGEGILADIILGASTEVLGGVVYDAVGIGTVAVVGSSLVEPPPIIVYAAVGVGSISIVGSSLAELYFDVVGIGSITVNGASIVKAPTQIAGSGIVNVVGVSQVKLPTVVNGIGLVNIVGLSTYVKSITEIQPNWLSTHYLCHITQPTEYEVELKSVQIRYSNQRILISAIVPAATEYLSELISRIGNELRITTRFNYADGSYQDFVLALADLTDVRLDQGAFSGETLTLSATRLITTNTNIFDLIGASYRYQLNGGSRRYRCELDPRVRPGDTVNINSESFVVSSITQFIDVSNILMEIAE